MDTVPDCMAVLNKCRQIVFANRAFRRMLGVDDSLNLYGKRPGEAMGCCGSTLTTDGCGASEQCLDCGMGLACLNSLGGIPDSQETVLSLARGGVLSLQVWTMPFEHEGERYLLFCGIDPKDPSRRSAMEHLFFHKLLHCERGFEGVVDILGAREPRNVRAEGFACRVLGLSAALMDEVGAQRDLAAAESGTLALKMEDIGTRLLLEELAEAFRPHRVAREKTLAIDPASSDVTLHTDRGVVRRALGHLVKNALQASRVGDTVTMRWLPGEGSLVFEVHNRSYIPEADQTRLFQRVCAPDGLSHTGTYSARLVTEKFLGGQVSFTTHRRHGTVFRVTLPQAR